jgi:tetratricopeptide (TPR) repeat protein
MIVVGATMRSEGTSDSLRFSVLGPVRAWRGADEVDLGTPQQRVLLSRSGAGYRLDLDSGALDLLRFGDLVAEVRGVRATDPDRAAALMTEAVLLWRGPVVADPSGTRRGGQVFAEVNRRLAQAVLDAAELATGRDRAGRVLPALRAAVAAAPFDEAMHAALMRVLAATGRAGEALEVFQDLRARLADELGVYPGTEVTAAHQEILHARSDPPTVPATDRSVPVRPAQLPLDLPTFSGREENRERLAGCLLGEGSDRAVTRVAIVLGMGGVGKTSLAVHCAHRVAGRFPDGQLYVNLRGFDPSGTPLSPNDAVRGFLTALGVPDSAMPDTFDARVALYRSMTAERAIILVLDNARDAHQARPLLPGGPRCAVIVTSRDPLIDLIVREGAFPVPLEPMSDGEAETLLTRRLGKRVAADPGAAQRVIASGGGLPLALSIFSARAVAHAHFTLSQLAAELDASRDRLDAFGRIDGAHNLRAVFSWSYRLLGSGAAHLFRLLSLHPGPAVGTAAVASLIGDDPRRTAQLLAELRRANLVTEATPSQFRMHDLVRAYSRELLRTAETEETMRTASTRLLDHYVHTAIGAATRLNALRSADTVAPTPPRPGAVVQQHTGCRDAIAWFERERAALLATIEAAMVAGLDPAVWQLAWAMENYLQRRHFWAEWGRTQTYALDAGRRAGDVPAQARARYSLGNLYSARALDLPATALTHVREAVRLFTACGDDVRLAHSYILLARVSGSDHDWRGYLAKALELYERVERCGGVSTIPDYVTHIYLQLGEFTTALPYALRSVALLRDAGDRHREATAFTNLAEIHARLGNWVCALAASEQAVRLYVEEGDHFMAATHLEELGRISAAAGRRLPAVTQLRRARAVYRRLGLPGHAESARSAIDDLLPRP